MTQNAIHILLVDDVKFDISEIKRQLRESMKTPFTLTHLSELGNSIETIKNNDPAIDAIVLDLGLISLENPENMFTLIKEAADEVPIIVITGNEEHDLALFAVRAGASDNLTRGNFRNTFGKLSDAIEFSLLRAQILKSERRKTKDSETIKEHLIAYISG
jgi:DNA-binding NtrC family response regulator